MRWDVRSSKRSYSSGTEGAAGASCAGGLGCGDGAGMPCAASVAESRMSGSRRDGGRWGGEKCGSRRSRKAKPSGAA
eukprot:1482483-Pleurochrysis_carterae.AAC.1